MTKICIFWYNWKPNSKICRQFRLWFDHVDGFYLNYWWTENKLTNSVKYLKEHFPHKTLADLYVGVDVWGRNATGSQLLYYFIKFILKNYEILNIKLLHIWGFFMEWALKILNISPEGNPEFTLDIQTPNSHSHSHSRLHSKFTFFKPQILNYN